jgi:hypothetical protein
MPLTDTTSATITRIANNDPTLTAAAFEVDSLGKENGNLVAEALSRNTHLRELSLGCLHLGNQGFQPIAKVLSSSNKTLTILTLSSNLLDDKGAEIIANMLLVNRSIVYLNLLGNNIEINGGKVIKEALSHNTSLINFNLFYRKNLSDEKSQLLNEIDALLIRNRNTFEEQKKVLQKPTVEEASKKPKPTTKLFNCTKQGATKPASPAANSNPAEESPFSFLKIFKCF